MNDVELERRFREGLHRRAERVDVPPGLLPRSRRRRRRSAAVLATVAAVAAVAVVAVGVDALHPGSRQEHAVSDPGRSDVAPVDTAGWRTEAWHGLQVQVPGDWGWGTAPVRGYLCGGPGAVVDPDGRRTRADPDTPYVGRPIMLSDLCAGGFAEQTPTAPYVWLGADIPAGTVGLGGGYVQQTVELQGTTLTVATDDPALREQILASARASECPATVADQLPQGSGLGANESIGGAHVCVYQRDGTLQLVYAATLNSAQAIAYALTSRRDADLDRGPTEPSHCATDELVVVRLNEFDGHVASVHQSVADPGCDRLSVTPGRWIQLGGRTQQAIARIGGLRVILRSQIGLLG